MLAATHGLDPDLTALRRRPLTALDHIQRNPDIRRRARGPALPSFSSLFRWEDAVPVNNPIRLDDGARPKSRARAEKDLYQDKMSA
jgi:hypothetical protein